MKGREGGREEGREGGREGGEGGREGGRKGRREGRREGGKEGREGGECYTLIRLEIRSRTRWLCLKSVIVYLARDIPAFVMYCVNGESVSSLLESVIESTDSMISPDKALIKRVNSNLISCIR